MRNGRQNIRAIISLCSSCLSLICCAEWTIALIMAVIGILLGVLELRQEKPIHEDMAIAGVVVGSVSMLLAIAVAIIQIIIWRNTAQQGLETVSAIASMCAMRGIGG